MGVDWGQMAAGFAGGVVKQMDARDKEAADTRAEDRAANRQLAMQERLMAAREMMETRASERKQKLAADQGGMIEKESRGMLNASDAQAITAAHGGAMTPEDAEALRDNPAARKAYGLPDETARTDVAVKGKAARKLGMLSHSDEYSKQERLLISDEDKKEDNKRQAKRDESTVEYQKGMLKNSAESIALRAQVAESKAEARAAGVTAKADKKDIPASDKMAIRQHENEISHLRGEKLNMYDPGYKAEKAANDSRIKVLQQKISKLGGFESDEVAAPSAPEPTETPTAATNAKVLANPSLKDAYIKRFGQRAYDGLTKK